MTIADWGPPGLFLLDLLPWILDAKRIHPKWTTVLYFVSQKSSAGLAAGSTAAAAESRGNQGGRTLVHAAFICRDLRA